MANKLSVSQLNNYIKGVFDDELVLQKIYLYGEVYEFSISGAITYITLKENDCYIQCVKFSKLEKIEVGTMVTLFGSVNFYRKSGRVNFNILSVQKAGAGKHHLEFLELKNKLMMEGLFSNKYKLPQFVQTVAIITSSTGAVIHDFLSVLYQKHPYIQVNIIKSKVQGEDAIDDLCRAMEEVESQNPDLVVIARGGGSGVDLSCFNDEKVVRKLSSLTFPTISAIGHETDYTLCDLASTVRAGTPSIAGGIINDINDKQIDRLSTALIVSKNAVLSKFERQHARLYRTLTKISVSASDTLDNYKFKIINKTSGIRDKIEKLIHQKYAYLRENIAEIKLKAEKKLTSGENSFGSVVSTIENRNPLKVLSLGYSKVTKNGVEITKSSQLAPLDEINIRFCDGQINATVKE